MMLELEFEGPYESDAALAMLAAHAVPGTEQVDVVVGTVTRLIPRAGRGPIVVTAGLSPERVTIESDAGDPDPATVRAVRRWLDLDADVDRINAALRNDPVLEALVLARPGLRVIGHPNGFEAAMMTILGQQVSLAAGRTFGSRLVGEYGTPAQGGLRAFPSAARVAAATPDELQAAIRVTGARSRTLHALAEACADSLVISADGDWADIRHRLLAIPGIGPWTVDYLAIRVLGDRDAYPAGDLVLRRALGGVSERQALAAASGWSPYRAHACFHLWTAASYAPREGAGRPGAS